MTPRSIRAAVVACSLALLAAACGDDAIRAEGSGPGDFTSVISPVTLTLVTHDSFTLSDTTLVAFTEATGIEVELLAGGDAGAALNQLILTKDNPEADVFFGVDNTFLSRALDQDLFVPYASPNLADIVDQSQILDPEHRVTPVDYSDVCLNYDRAAVAALDIEPPTTIADLTDPAYAGLLVVENPATSSPGLAFLLATVAAFGEAGWQDFWAQLTEADVLVVDGWDEAYYTEFSQYGGDRPLVVSYASSPPAEVFFAAEPVDEAPTGSIAGTCFRQIEFAGIVAGTDHVPEAQQLIDFLLSDTYQSDLPLTQFVFPVTDVELPDVFVEHAQLAETPLTLDPDDIAEHRDEWIETWTEIVLRS